jgi:hypothetical protein
LKRATTKLTTFKRATAKMILLFHLRTGTAAAVSRTTTAIAGATAAETRTIQSLLLADFLVE